MPEYIKRNAAYIVYSSSIGLKKCLVQIAQENEASRLALSIYQICKLQGIDLFIGGSFDDNVPRINIHSNNFNELKSILNGLVSSDKNLVFISNGKIIKTLPVYIDGRNPPPFDIGIVRHKSNNVIFFSVVEIALWNDIIRFGRFRTVCTRTSSYFSRAENFSALTKLSEQHDFQARSRTEISKFPIDVVLTWVDGADPQWLSKKDRYLGNSNVLPPYSTAHLEERFKSRNELKYALRSIHMFAPFVRTIFIVTDNQVPNWLQIDNKNIKLIDHKDIFFDESALPTFNSHSIETQLHHIDGLSEHFIYMNDDMFFGKFSSKEEYFDSNGIAKVFPEPQHIVPELVSVDDEEYVYAGMNAVNLLEKDFNSYPSRLMMHSPYSVRRSVMYEIESRYNDIYQTTARNKYRSRSDISPISFFYCHYAHLIGKAVLASIEHEYLALWTPSLALKLNKLLNTRQASNFCLNDAGVRGKYAAKIDRIVASFLEEYFPIKSPFEK